jgi:hypothetical protein
MQSALAVQQELAHPVQALEARLLSQVHHRRKVVPPLQAKLETLR